MHAGKPPLFSADERIAMLKAEMKPIAAKTGTAIDIVTFDNLTVDAAREAGASVIFRGLRDATDFDYEMQMAGMNGAMAPGIETVFVAAAPGVRHIAANLVRQIALMGGDVSRVRLARRRPAPQGQGQSQERKRERTLVSTAARTRSARKFAGKLRRRGGKNAAPQRLAQRAAITAHRRNGKGRAMRMLTWPCSGILRHRRSGLLGSAHGRRRRRATATPSSSRPRTARC